MGLEGTVVAAVGAIEELRSWQIYFLPTSEEVTTPAVKVCSALVKVAAATVTSSPCCCTHQGMA
jgi:hypothetical protein